MGQPGEKRWDEQYRRKRANRIFVIRIRYGPSPLVVDFCVEAREVGREDLLFRLYWRDDDGSIVVDHFREGSEQPTKTTVEATSIPSAHAGYALVEDWLDDESFWSKWWEAETHGEDDQAQGAES